MNEGKIKRIIASILWAFVFFSAGYFVSGELHSRRTPESHPAESKDVLPVDTLILTEETNLAVNVQANLSNKVDTLAKVKSRTDEKISNNPQIQSKSLPSSRVVVYYFHRTQRCHTCLTLEKFSREAVEKIYQKELKSGKLEFKALNIELPENEHFISDFDLYGSALIVARYDDKKLAEFKDLAEIWTFAGEPEKFNEYVKGEIDKILEKVK